jgi:hypothetical protein
MGGYLGAKSLSGCEFFADSAGHRSIAVGNSTGIVRDQSEDNLVVSHVYVWMMACGLCEDGYSVYELHGLDEVLESPLPYKLSRLQRPLWIGPQHVFDL